MKRVWTRGEKALFLAPILVGVAALALQVGPNVARRAMGWPQVLVTTPNNHLQSLALASGGTILAASGQTDPIGSSSGTIYLWNARTLQPLPPIRTTPTRNPLTDFVTDSLDFSPDGQFLGAQRHQRGYSLYHLPSARLLWRKNYASYAKFSPDGKRIALATQGTITVLNTADGALIGTWKTAGKTDYPYSDALSWSPDGLVIACLGRRFELPQSSEEQGNRERGQRIELRRVSDGKLLRTLQSQLTIGVRFSPDGHQIIAVAQHPSPTISNGTDGDAVRLYNVKTGQKVWEVDGRKLYKATGNNNESWFCDALFSPDGQQIAAFQHQNQSVLLLDARTGRETRRLRFRARASNRYIPPALAFSPDGKRLFASADNAVLVWDLK